jgi:osmotically-inducible protein OsmY
MENKDISMKDIGAAMLLTPNLKAAIVANSELNDGGNHINVDSDEHTVTLRGHVKSLALKNLAEDIVMRTLQERGARQSLTNELIITP